MHTHTHTHTCSHHSCISPLWVCTRHCWNSWAHTHAHLFPPLLQLAPLGVHTTLLDQLGDVLPKDGPFMEQLNRLLGLVNSDKGGYAAWFLADLWDSLMVSQASTPVQAFNTQSWAFLPALHLCAGSLCAG